MSRAIDLAPPPDDVHGPVPRLDTYWQVERILRDAFEADEGPLSLEEIKRRMPAKSMRHATIRTCVDELARQGLVSSTPTGVMWTLMSADAEKFVRDKKWVDL